MEEAKDVIVYDAKQDISVYRQPEVVLAEAHKAAKALKNVLDTKTKKVVFQGKQYLENEDWQTVARFYGITAKEDGDPELVAIGDATGFKASSVAIRSDGMVISRATAYCLNDERNWKGKPMFQLASMAQTRANSKVLRNVLSWVVVLAGYAATPAEEMAEIIENEKRKAFTQPAQPNLPKEDIPEPEALKDDSEIIKDLKKQLSDRMKGFHKDEKKAFYDFILCGNETADALIHFLEDYDSCRDRYMQSRVKK